MEFIFEVDSASDHPALELFAGYRYIQTEDPTFDARAAGFAGGTIDAEYSTHEVFGGLRVFF